jgi:predicted nucleic acid-binding protein
LKERDDLLDIFLSVCEWTRVYYIWRPNLPDETDNHLIELAVAGGADLIVTRNLRDIQGGELHFPQLRIISPEAFLKEI